MITASVGAIVTSGYNPTGLAVRDGEELLALNSGIIDIVDGAGVPQTDAAPVVLETDWMRYQPGPATLTYSPAQERELNDRLKALGYLSDD